MREIDRHFQQLETDRECFFRHMENNSLKVWQRPKPDKWSAGETLYNLYLLARLVRMVSTVYIPLVFPAAYLWRRQPYFSEIHDIYADYQRVNGKPMPAPAILEPPEGLERKYNFSEVKNLLDVETARFKRQTASIPDDIAGHIRYPDPIAQYPNLVQSVHLLGIHERHHFRLVQQYYADERHIEK